MSATVILPDKIYSLAEKVEFLRHPEIYPDNSKVDFIETHMSCVFLTDKFVYKLKKPVSYPFLDFSTIEARYKFCMEELTINQLLGGDTYIGVIPLKAFRKSLRLTGKGEIIDWLVKMKRLSQEQMLDTVIKNGMVRTELVQLAAEKLADFYLGAAPVFVDGESFRKQMMEEIDLNNTELLRPEFELDHSLTIGMATDLLHFVIKHGAVFDHRIIDGRIIETHGDLRPEHIWLGAEPMFIDRLEFSTELRIMDVAEELSFLALECETLLSPNIGQLFLNVYKWKSLDKIPEMLVQFYKAKRAFLRARLSIHHLLEERYQADEELWKRKCYVYLQIADGYCKQLPKMC